MLAALLLIQALSPPASAPAAHVTTQTPAAAMDYLARTLPNVTTFDAWEGGWGEAPLDRAKFGDDPCQLTTGAPFVKLYYDNGEQHDAPLRQSWHVDLSNISAVGQTGNRAGYKVANDPKLIMGFVARDAETAKRIAAALETMRLYCTS